MARIGHAVVMGASVTGLAAAAAVAGHADRVTVVDRDVLPDQPRHRKGTPQAHHLHSLMASGQQAL
jgi:2-polyprenyl-6-methoxyphenol hydroxylase-like FAD-dependent oxidoreductase